MTFETTPNSNPAGRPARVRFLAEIPLSLYETIRDELIDIPDWDRYFIMKNPVAWPDKMRQSIEKHLNLANC